MVSWQRDLPQTSYLGMPEHPVEMVYELGRAPLGRVVRGELQ